MKRTLMAAALSLGVLAAQERGTFEVASLRRVDPSVPIPAKFSTRGGPGTTDPTRFECRSCPLALLIAKAYEVALAQVSGPDWLMSDLFEVQAKVPEKTSLDDFRAMLRSLLVERFQLKARREDRESTGYELTAMPGPLKMQASGPPQNGPDTYLPVDKRLDPAGYPILRPGEVMAMSLGHYRRQATETMPEFARFLTIRLGRPVVDRTGLAGRYDTRLSFFMPMPDDAALPQEPGPTLIDAIRENGLKLTSKKVSVEYIIVESALRNPIDN